MLDYRMTYSNVCGISHKKDNTPCEDYCFCDARNGLAAICVCDGAGSAKFSQYGAEIAAETTVTFLLENYFSYREAITQGREFVWNQELKKQIIAKFQEDLKQQPQRIHSLICNSEYRSKNKDYEIIKDRLKTDFENLFKSCVESWSKNTCINTNKNSIPDKIRKLFNDEFYQKTLPQWQNLLEKYKQEIENLQFLNVRGEEQILKEISFSAEKYLKEYACTIVALVVTQEGDWLSIHIGDGGIIGQKLDQDIFLISGPDNTEFANQTWFITSDDALDKIRINCNTSTSERINGALLFSDGPEGSLLSFNKPKKVCKNILEETLQNGFSFEKSQAFLEQLIKNYIQKCSCDDCTIGIIKGFDKNFILSETGKKTNIPYSGDFPDYLRPSSISSQPSQCTQKCNEVPPVTQDFANTNSLQIQKATTNFSVQNRYQSSDDYKELFRSWQESKIIGVVILLLSLIIGGCLVLFSGNDIADERGKEESYEQKEPADTKSAPKGNTGRTEGSQKVDSDEKRDVSATSQDYHEKTEKQTVTTDDTSEKPNFGGEEVGGTENTNSQSSPNPFLKSENRQNSSEINKQMPETNAMQSEIQAKVQNIISHRWSGGNYVLLHGKYFGCLLEDSGQHYYYRNFKGYYIKNGIHFVFNDKRVFDEQNKEQNDPNESVVTFLQSLQEITIIDIQKDYCEVKILYIDGNSEQVRFNLSK